MKKIVVCLILLLIILNICIKSFAIQNENENSIYLDVTNTEIKTGDEFSLSINLGNTNVSAFDLQIYFNDELLEYVSGPENTNVVGSKIITVWYDETGGEKAKQNCELVKYTFKAKEIGTEYIAIQGEFYNTEGIEVENFTDGIEIIANEETKTEFIEVSEQSQVSSSNSKLEILRLINKEDIKLIKKLSRFDIYYLEKLSKFVDLEEAYKKVLGLKENQNNVHEYLDYLEAARFLKLPLHDKKVLYPSNLLKEHDKLIEQVQIVENAEHDKLIQKRLEDLNKNIYKNNKYIVFPAPSAEALLKESEEQHNCVFKSYLKKYCNSLTDIYFLRKVDSPNKSFVTVEVNNNRVVQAKAKYNEDVSKETQKFLDRWERRLQKVAIR